jgi:UDP-glucose 4-epimerase
VNGSIFDDEMLKRVFKEKPEYVFHLAVHFANQNSVDNPETDLMVNGLGTLKVLQYAHLADVELKK